MEALWHRVGEVALDGGCHAGDDGGGSGCGQFADAKYVAGQRETEELGGDQSGPQGVMVGGSDVDE